MEANSFGTVSPVPQVEPQWEKDHGVTTETAPRNMRFVRVSLDELDDLKSSNSTIELALFGVSFGALITIATTLRTVALPDDLTKTVFVVLVVVLALASIFFAATAIRAEIRWRKRVNRLKGEQSPQRGFFASFFG